MNYYFEKTAVTPKKRDLFSHHRIPSIENFASIDFNFILNSDQYYAIANSN